MKIKVKSIVNDLDRYFPCYLSLAFLESHCLSLSLAAISLHLDPTT